MEGAARWGGGWPVGEIRRLFSCGDSMNFCPTTCRGRESGVLLTGGTPRFARLYPRLLFAISLPGNFRRKIDKDKPKGKLRRAGPTR